MDGQVRQAGVAGGDVAGRAAGQPDNVAVGKSLLSVRCSDGAATSDDNDDHVEVRFGVGVHALPGSEMDEVRVELATRLGERPPGTRLYGRVIDEFVHVEQDPHRWPIGQEASWNRR